MRLVIYARKSTESEDRQIQSLEDQIQSLRHLALREGHDVVEVFQESRSAKAPGNRPEFERLIEEIDSGNFDGILTWSMDRLSRNPVDGGRIAYLLQTGQISMIRTFERKYLPSDNALLLSIENGMATAYIQDLSRNVKRGMKGKFDRGWLPVKAPIGYRNDAETREIVPDPDRFQLVRQAWELFLQGEHSVGQIGDEMRRWGLTSYSRKSKKPLVSRNYAHRMLRNPFYMGVIQMSGESTSGKHLPMVSQDEYEQAQALLEGSRRSTRRHKRPFLFRNKIWCDKCGCIVLGERKTRTYPRTNRTVEYTYYHCSGSKGCSKRGIREEDIVSQIKSVATEVKADERYSDWLSESIVKQLELRLMSSSDNGPAVAKVQSRLDKLISMRADGELSQAEYERAKGQAASELALLRKAAREAADGPKKLLQAATERIAAGRLARHVATVTRDPARYPTLLSAAGTTSFKGGRLTITPHRSLQKIATLEPVFLKSRSKDSGDSLFDNSFWWSQVEEILNLIERELAQQSDTPVQRTKRHQVRRVGCQVPSSERFSRCSNRSKYAFDSRLSGK